MTHPFLHLIAWLVFAATSVSSAAEGDPYALLEADAVGAARLVPSSAKVNAAAAKEGGIEVAIQPGGGGYPGVALKPEAKEAWDLSKFGHVEARIVNTGAARLMLSLRVDNAGDWQDNPWNTESLTLAPGESGSVVTVFGHSFGGKPGFPLKPAAVTGLMLFAAGSEARQSFRIEALQAAGAAGEKPPSDPAGIRLRPPQGCLAGGPAKLLARQLSATQGAVLTMDGDALVARFSGKSQLVRIRPPEGRWDLREAHQVRIRLKNTGAAAATPSARVESDAGPTDLAAAAAPIPPGGSGEIVVSFIPAIPWTGVEGATKSQTGPGAGSGTRFTSDAASAVTLELESGGQNGAASFKIESITAAAPPDDLPGWLGKRPPVEGQWTRTFNEDFDGKAIDLSKWNIHTANYWDQLSHFSRDNVVVGGGVARLRYEKKTGRHNDDPAGKETPYATGFLDTYGKWVQRYGYFEARMKLPRAPGLWPAFWLMPDRGLDSGEQWQRATTGQGGMEFDIMEFLSRWGPYRYNIAFHWDGYQEDHQQMGTSTLYTAADRDGFITAGLLWLPGEATMYCNGRVTARWKSPRVSSVPSDLMFTHVMGGWDNDDLDDSRLPDEFVIDYVRCWQREELASDLDGVKSTKPSPAAPVSR